MSLSCSVLRTDKYNNVRVRVPLLPEIGKTPILADSYEVSIFLNSVAIRTYFSASVTGTLGNNINLVAVITQYQLELIGDRGRLS